MALKYKKILKTLIVLFSISVTLGIGYLVCSQINIPVERVAEWRNYTNKHYNYSIKYPKDWVIYSDYYKGEKPEFPDAHLPEKYRAILAVTTFANQKAVRNLAIPDHSLERGEYMVSIRISENREELSLKDWVDMEENELLPNHCKKYSIHSIIVNKLPAIRVKEKCKVYWHGAPCLINIYFIKGNMRFLLMYEGGDFKTEDIFNTMVKSFINNIK